ncbi:MAG: AAA family ATPase [Phaeodactylibacter sp.]|uniref:UvrD-helicase domain-containing protein n=1 Tax=Phaeodactylibacter sp. TaxID=1940289 RepID=UPI0032EC4983
MELLRYNEFSAKGMSSKLKKVEQMLRAGDFKSAEVKKMKHLGYFRAKLDRENRLLFKFAKHQGETYILLLEVIPNHEYDKSRFLRGASVKENHFSEVAGPGDVEEDTVEPIRYINQASKRFHLLDKVISLDRDQEEIYNLPAPLIIIGSAGSGKTALTLEKMKGYPGNVAYVSLSPYLVENAQRIYESFGYENQKQEIDFLSFREYLEGIQIPEGRELDYRSFERWYERGPRQRFKFKEPYKLFEEFKGVLTGSVTDAPYLSRKRYEELGVKQSIFLGNERGKVYDLFERYLRFLKENDYYDSNMVAYQYMDQVAPKYDFIIVDEVQDVTNIQLLLILKALKTPGNFLLSGDANQIVHPNFFSWSKIKSLFFNQDLKGSALRILKTNYRNSRQVTKLSNDLLKIKNARFGSIDKESTYLINTVADTEGKIHFYPDSAKVRKELNKRTQDSAKFAVLVLDKLQKAQVAKDFKTPLVFTIQEAKGLEYENIILVNFISDHDSEFRTIAKGVTEADLLDENLQYSRAKDKTNKDQEAYKFYINSLYVAFTRAVQNVHIVETKTKNELLQLLGVMETEEEVKIEQQASDEEEWLEEARRLELQGKFEQAEAIRARLRGIEFVGSDEAELLEERIFDPEVSHTDKDVERLFLFARTRHRIGLVQRLHEALNYGPAKQYLGEYKKAQQQLAGHVRNNNRKKAERLIGKFGVDIPDATEGMTGLMIAAQYGKIDMLYYFLDQDADRNRQDNLGRTALQHLILGYDRRQLNKFLLETWYPKLAPSAGQCRYDGRLYIINHKSMAFFLYNVLNAIRLDVFAPNDPLPRRCLLMDDFMQFIEEMPPSLLPDYRRKRQYVNSILSKHEVDRDDPYNRKLFVRRSRGCYDVLPGAEVTWG